MLEFGDALLDEPHIAGGLDPMALSQQRFPARLRLDPNIDPPSASDSILAGRPGEGNLQRSIWGRGRPKRIVSEVGTTLGE